MTCDVPASFVILALRRSAIMFMHLLQFFDLPNLCSYLPIKCFDFYFFTSSASKISKVVIILPPLIMVSSLCLFHSITLTKLPPSGCSLLERTPLAPLERTPLQSSLATWVPFAAWATVNDLRASCTTTIIH